MNIDFELYRVFYTVANCGNITRASEELHISQPAISKALKNLESQLGGQLFVRTKKGVVLTIEGKEFYGYIKQAIEYITSAENKFSELKNLESGCIKIGANSTIVKKFLLPYLKVFNEKFPKVDIQITTDLTSELLVKLRNGIFDLVFLNINDKSYAQDLEIIKCQMIHDCFVANEKFKELKTRKLSLNDLNDYPLIVQAKGSNTRAFLDYLVAQKKLSLKPHFELSSYSLVEDFTKEGFGIGYLVREYIDDELKNGNLFEIKISEKLPTRYVGVAISKNHLPNFSTKRFLDLIIEKED